MRFKMFRTYSGIFFLFKLCNHFFFTSSLLDGRRWKLIFLLSSERFVHPGALQFVIFKFNMMAHIRKMWTFSSFFLINCTSLFSCLFFYFFKETPLWFSFWIQWRNSEWNVFAFFKKQVGRFKHVFFRKERVDIW